jgi:Extracellular mutant protein 11
MSGMNSFVNRKAGQLPQASQSVNQGQLRNQQNATTLKVAVPSMTKSNISQSRNVTTMQPPMNTARGKATIGGPMRDTFAATEYSGSTTSTISRVQVRDSQVDDQGRPFASYDEHYHPNGPPGIEEFAEDDGEESGSDDEYEDGEESDNGGEEQDLAPQQQHHFQQAQVAMNQQQLKRNPFDGNDSYPPTTTGGPDEEEADGGSSQAEEAEQPAPPQQRVPLYQQSNRHLDAPLQRPVSGYQQHLPTQQEQAPSYFAGRSQRQLLSRPNLPLRQSPPAAKPVSQPNLHLNPATVLENARPGSAPQPPQAISKLNSKTRPTSTGWAKVNPPSRVPDVAPPVIQEPEVSVEEGPHLDYDEETLKAMEYKQLQDEDYDMDPSRSAFVLPNEGHDTLPERLGLVQKMTPENQRTFFASLPLVEWEEAGDWFLSQFSEVVKKMTDARKEKRQLATKFEGEIAKRHEHVASRKRGIDEALSEMGKSGRDVLKGSTPKRRRGPGNGI